MANDITICDCGHPEGHTGNVWHPGQPIPSFVKMTEEELLAKLHQAKVASAAMALKSAEFSLVVTRCGCGNPDSHNGKLGPARPCPTPRLVSDLGVVDKADRNIIKRLHWRLFGKRDADKRIAAANQA